MGVLSREKRLLKRGWAYFRGWTYFPEVTYRDGLFLDVLISSLANTKTTLEIICFSPPSTALSANEQGVPSESYLQEVREQLEERKEKPEEQRHTRSVSDNAGLYQ